MLTARRAPGMAHWVPPACNVVSGVQPSAFRRVCWIEGVRVGRSVPPAVPESPVTITQRETDRLTDQARAAQKTEKPSVALVDHH